MTMIQRSSKKKSRFLRISPQAVVILFVVCFVFLVLNNSKYESYHSYEVERSFQTESHRKELLKRRVKSIIPREQFQNQTDLESFNREVPHGHPWPSPIEMLGEDAILNINPIFGKHRPDKDAVFSFTSGISLKELVRFVGSLLSTG